MCDVYVFDSGMRRRRRELVDDRIGFGIYQSCWNRLSVGRVSLFGLRWCRWGVGRCLDNGLEGWCYVCVSCESGFFCVDDKSRYLHIVLGGYLRFLVSPSVQSCCTISISASYHVFFMTDIANPDLFVCGCRT